MANHKAGWRQSIMNEATQPLLCFFDQDRATGDHGGETSEKESGESGKGKRQKRNKLVVNFRRRMTGIEKKEMGKKWVRIDRWNRQ